MSVRILSGVVAFVFLILCLWAEMQISFFSGMGPIFENPWGLATIVDLYIGFFMFGGFLLLIEPDKKWAYSGAILTLFLGNIVGLVVIMFRLPVWLKTLGRNS